MRSLIFCVLPHYRAIKSQQHHRQPNGGGVGEMKLNQSFILKIFLLILFSVNIVLVKAQASYGIPLANNNAVSSTTNNNGLLYTSSSSAPQPVITRRPSLFSDALVGGGGSNGGGGSRFYPTTNGPAVYERQAKSLVPTSSASLSSPCLHRIVGYYTWWSTVPLRTWQAHLLTHINYAFLFLLPNGTVSVEPGAPELFEDGRQARHRLQELLDVRRQIMNDQTNSNLKLLFSVGGWSGSQHFSSVAAQPDLVDNMIRSAIQLLIQYDFDGIDLDWEYPVQGGAGDVPASPTDLNNYVLLVARLRAALNEAALLRRTRNNNNNDGRSQKYLLTIASAGSKFTLDAGFDLVRLAQFVDWFNVMSYDYFGAWDSQYGALTGPVAPLFFGAPRNNPNYSDYQTVDYAIKYHVCHLTALTVPQQQQQQQQQLLSPFDTANLLDKIVLGIPFYGRYWNNAGQWPVDRNNDLWRIAEPSVIVFDNSSTTQQNNGFGATQQRRRVAGGVLGYAEIKAKWLVNNNNGNNNNNNFAAGNNIIQKFDEQTRTPFIWNPTTQVLLTYENVQSVWEKTKYAADHGLGGVMFWSLDLDEDRIGQSLLETVAQAAHVCPDGAGSLLTGGGRLPNARFDCSDMSSSSPTFADAPPVTSINAAASGPARWWNYDLDPKRAGMCGKSAPLLNGFYPICNPNDAEYGCCSAFGFCVASTGGNCNCVGCVNYYGRPSSALLLAPERPSIAPVRWHTLDAAVAPGQPRCGFNAPRIVEGVSSMIAICNPDDENAHCCSAAGFCGTGSEYCECEGCINYALGGHSSPSTVSRARQQRMDNNGIFANSSRGLFSPNSNNINNNQQYIVPQPGTFPAIVTISPTPASDWATTTTAPPLQSWMGRQARSRGGGGLQQGTVVEYDANNNAIVRGPESPYVRRTEINAPYDNSATPRSSLATTNLIRKLSIALLPLAIAYCFIK